MEGSPLYREGKRTPLHVVHTESSRGWGGQEIRILTEIAGMRARGHRVTLLCPGEARIFTEAQARGLPVQALPIGRKHLGGVKALYRWLRAQTPDVVNCHSSTDAWLTAWARLLLRRPPPLVRTRHISAPIPKNRFTRWLYQTATAHIVTTGERLRATLIAENGFNPAAITSVPTGIDTVRFVPGDKPAARRALKIDGGALVVGIVATLRSWKGHDYLLQAFAGMADVNAVLLIVGDGPQRQALAAAVAARGLRSRVMMPGDQRDVLPWFQAMDIFALPSYANEGVPQAIMQAMLCALPVVTTAIGSIPEIVTPGHTGLLVTPKDADALQQALTRLATDPDLRERLGTAARAYGLAHFTLELMLDRMEAVFTRVSAPAAAR